MRVHTDGTLSARWNRATWRIVLTALNALPPEKLDAFGDTGAMRLAQAAEEIERGLR